MSADDDTSPRAEDPASPSLEAAAPAIDDLAPLAAMEAAPAAPVRAPAASSFTRVLIDIADVFAPLGADASSRGAILARIVAHLVAIAVAIASIVVTIRPLTSPRPPPPLPGIGTEGQRFGLSLDRRRAIFTQLAATEAYSRRMGTQGFPTQPWSAEDHRCAYERDAVRGTAARFGLDLSTAYLIMDEGIRSHWPGPDGQPLLATTIPLDPRRE